MNPSLPDAKRFRELHAPGQVLVLPNVWDAMSARLVESLGGAALATSSAAVAWAHGAPDGERLEFDRLLASTRDIVRAVRVPVSVDFERGYNQSAADVADAVCRLAQEGVVGINLEDGAEPPEVLTSKLSACREAFQRQGLDVFLNARTDVILRRMLSGPQALDEVIRRTKRYADAGCDGIFVPGLSAAEDLARVVSEVSVPLNVWAAPALPPVDQLRAMGVRRVSVGPRLALTALSAARRDAEHLMAGHWAPPPGETPLTYPQVNGWFTQTPTPSKE
ncbi:isocitrate lyase/phosphoenolpyruvate mutase family protein [Stigmatella sp. ncwal1]|uniref:Isocitrate lyase/phosphoenolpyruvate mutase family protein n=1 Tax=Stigmatella ashevillensis TaxID=2995309 RepID=A0ABT5DAW8_9BACT|nr:isocitrate lyase/phosphoenolpyruvate mutase family protein [Stigmatella ashevillena]MDC0709441.1 isocitrate lyase/phosphoenolpyruvate mutase family protein [Stigmatella ashevillena]